jgi:hypothetical protein
MLITAGHAGGKGEGGIRLVPRLDLASAVQKLLETRRLHIVPSLAQAATLTRELMTFRAKVTLTTGNDTLEAWRERPHDDLVLAVAVAAWQGERYRPFRLESFGPPPEPPWLRPIWPGWARLARGWT